MRSATRLAAILLSLGIILPATAFAQQASITGVVRDSSGAVLPGVTVEASSPALIEQSRSVVTDGTGQYRIVDLRAGTYVVTFTLTGFTTVRREGIELTATFVATVNSDLRVAAVAETVTVSGESPIVDVQSSQTVRTIDNEVFAGHSEQSLVRRGHRADAGDQRAGGGCRRRGGQRIQRLSGARRPAQRGPGPNQRVEHRLAGHGGVRLRARGRQRAGNLLPGHRRPRRGGNRRPTDESDPAGGRQLVPRVFPRELCR